ncbi:AcrR family transcriptional regulator [Rhizobium sp. BK650]|uniref:TetR/AcrR family transcriptional regulator n=1 Tax=Rhizobium sp. BK650 TaxID=2586990 RepID=UPI001622B795|nr:helix-turn-helix domain-containing protein [Rhizobium sp. BK650]MBB3660728.1 AcrR family transcriptional regulator [Rhizobium sp. BK650]
MAQVLKKEMHARILRAAGKQFAARGFEAVRLADIAREAGTAVSNIYKYVADKEALFLQVVTPALAERHMQLLLARLDEFGERRPWTALTDSQSYAAARLLEFWVDHPHVGAILMGNAQGSRFAFVREQMIEEMTSRAMKTQGKEVRGSIEFVLRRIFSSTLDTICAVLQQYKKPEEIRDAIGCFWRFQLAGLQALLKEEAA